MGPSGSGKSTLLAVIARALDPASGRYLLDEADVTTLPLEDVRSILAIMDDEPHVFATSVRANLVLAAPDATDDEVIARHSVFGGDYLSESTGEGGPRIITVRPGAVADRAPAVEAPEVVELAAAELGPDATPREIDARWRRWYEANRRVIGDDPHLLLPGTVLTSPVFAPHAGVDGPRP